MKDMKSWKYIKRNRIKFDEANMKSTENNHTTHIENEQEGIFYLKRIEPVTVYAAEVSKKEYKNPEVVEAMREELEKWNKFNAYEIVEDNSSIPEKIDARWMITRKEKHDGLKGEIKARLCIRGYKESEKPRSDSPTADRLSTKIFYSICANESFAVECLDITSAFLQGSELEREIYVIPPKEAQMEGML